jgi:hypothetical protein
MDHEVVARIRDTGIGMDEETRQRIFEPFFSTKSERGTGLGLSVARGIINRHRGSIAVESQPHLGAEFTVRFPAGQTPGPPPAPYSPGRLPRFRVLAVDEKPVLNVLADLLRARDRTWTRRSAAPPASNASSRATTRCCSRTSACRR